MRLSGVLGWIMQRKLVRRSFGTWTQYINAFSFTLDLALGLSIAQLIHVILDPPMRVTGLPEDVGHPGLTDPQRLVLFASAVALVRLLHSYAILNNRRSLRGVLSNMDGRTRRESVALVLKFSVVVILCYTVLVIAEPHRHEYILWLYPSLKVANLTSLEKSGVVTSIISLVPSFFVYILLFWSGSAIYNGLQKYKDCDRDSKEYLIFATFGSWLEIDRIGRRIFFLGVAGFYLACFVASGALNLKGLSAADVNASEFSDYLMGLLSLIEIALCLASLYLTGRDYLSNVKFYGMNLDSERGD